QHFLKIQIKRPLDHGVSPMNRCRTMCYKQPSIGLVNIEEQHTVPCFLPNTLNDHAFVVLNSYYQHHRHEGSTCYFNSAAVITHTDTRKQLYLNPVLFYLNQILNHHCLII
ncbi:unnamed protein product, partial [Thlaspi arvense]